jgi:hypothetical protein
MIDLLRTTKFIATVDNPYETDVKKGDTVYLRKTETGNRFTGKLIFWDTNGREWSGVASSWLQYFSLVGENTLKDNVNNPSHYGQGKIEAIEYIKDSLTTEEFIGYLRGNIAKYLHRWRYKNGLEDLEKARWYLNYLIKTEEEQYE